MCGMVKLEKKYEGKADKMGDAQFQFYAEKCIMDTMNLGDNETK